MKPTQFFILAILIFSLNANAQQSIPKGYKKGNIVLSNGTTITGYIKDNTSQDAAVSLLDESTWKKTKYSNQKLKTKLGWRPQVSTGEGLQRYFQSCKREDNYA